jgi:hypothetical protein
MNADDFEERLQRQSMRPVPAEWRGEILDAARRAGDHQLFTLNPRPTPWWREWLWPCPQAWAGLAAAWVLILALNAATRDPVQVAKTAKTASAPELLIALKEHRRLLAELIGTPTVLEPTKTLQPRPRSELSHRTVAV